MTTLSQIISDINKMKTSMKSNINGSLQQEGPAILARIKASSPFDTGEYRSNWIMSKKRFTHSSVIASMSFTNNTPYAFPMEFGAGINEAPWYYPNSGTKTGKLISSKGRVWAGGWMPGHSLTVGGAANNVLVENDSTLLRLTNSVADATIRSIK